MSGLLLIALMLLLAHSHDKRRQAERTVAELDAQLTASEAKRLELKAFHDRVIARRATEAVVTITADTSQFEAAMKRATESMKRLPGGGA